MVNKYELLRAALDKILLTSYLRYKIIIRIKRRSATMENPTLLRFTNSIS